MAMKKLLPLIAFIILLFLPNYVHCSVYSSLVTSISKGLLRRAKPSNLKSFYKKAVKKFNLLDLLDQLSSTNVQSHTPTYRPIPYSNVTFSNDTGLFNMEIYMGTPYNSLNLGIDTLSELLWVQCGLLHSSTVCQGDILYNNVYNNSVLTTWGSSCQDIVSFDGFKVDSSEIVQHYNPQKDFTFGCERGGVLNQARIPALAGLNRGNRSMASLLGGKFSYCLPTLDSTGFIYFTSTTGTLKYSPIMDEYDLCYVLKLGSITVADVEPIVVGSQPTAIVTSTLFSYFDSNTYRNLSSILRSSMNLYGLQQVVPQYISDNIQLGLCYSLSGEDLPTTLQLNVSFIFTQGQAVLELDNANLLYRVSESVVCFAFLDLGCLEFNILGSYQLTNHLVEHDNDKKLVGFAKYDDCSLSYQQSADDNGVLPSAARLLAFTLVAYLLAI